jgi:hypothetical protein
MRQTYKKGFGALIAVVLVSSGLSSFLIVALGASSAYSDLIYRKEMRIQSALDESACSDAAMLVKAKDAFVSGSVHIADLGCDDQI